MASDDQLDGLDLLLAAVESLPVPGAPPRLDRAGAWIGLSFLETALRQNHVRRFTESLRMAEHRTADRTVEIDLRLSLMHPRQIEAGLLYSAVRARRGGQDILRDGADAPSGRANTALSVNQLLGREGANSPLVWVPIARLSRRSTTPVEVLDAAGSRVPTLTQYETSRLLASGLYRLLLAILRSDPRASDTATEVYRLIEKDESARWLLQQAFLTLFEERATPTTRTEPAPRESSDPLVGCRNTARVVLEEKTRLSSFEELLRVAIQEYLLVAGLPNSKDEHHVRYTTPLEALPERRGGLVTHLIRQVAPTRRAYRVLYSTRLPSTLPAYHVVAETEPDLDIDHIILSSQADEAEAARLCGNLRYLAHLLRNGEDRRWSEERENLLSLELEACLLEISQLLRRRRWEAEHADGDLRPRLQALAKVSAAVIGLDDTGLDTGRTQLRPLRDPSITPVLLDEAADELQDFKLGRDLSTENDPKASRAHVYWRRVPSHRLRTMTIDAQCSIVIGDTTTDTTRIGAFAASVLAMTYLLGVFIFKDHWVWDWSGTGDLTEPGSVIAVLLLVPGFMYSRLDLPPMKLIVARLRVFLRLTAYLSIGSAALLAAYIATGPDLTDLRMAFSWALSAQVFAVLALLPRGFVALLARWQAMTLPGMPKWFRPRRRLLPFVLRVPARYEARFKAVELRRPKRPTPGAEHD